MKKIMFGGYIFLVGCLCFLYYVNTTKCDKLEIEFNNKLDGTSYNDKVNLLEGKSKELVNKINVIVDEDVSSVDEIDLVVSNLNLKYDGEIKKNKELNDTFNTLSDQKKVLVNQYNDLVEEERKRNSYLISGVTKMNQYSIGYPTGCESAALTMLLKYWGVNVSISDVVKLLPKGDKPYYENGIKYGGNPYLEFIGNPADKYSYGVYDKPIENVANNFKSGIINGRGKSLDEILAIVREGRPVVVWSSMNLGVPHYTNSWIYKPTGEKIKWLANLHAILVIGYNKDQVITTDSLTGTYRYFNRKTFESRYNAFGKRALYY